MFNPKPIKIKKSRKPLRKLGRIGKGNEAFTQQTLEAWFTQELLLGHCVKRDLNGAPESVTIQTADDYVAWINREVLGKTTKHYHFKGVNLNVGHIEDKCLRPDLRWTPRNVAPITPYSNKLMKYDHDKRDVMKFLMKQWVDKHLGVEGT